MRPQISDGVEIRGDRLGIAIAGALFMALTSKWFADSIETLADSAAIGLWIYHQWQPDDG